MTVHYILTLNFEKSRHPSILCFPLLHIRPSVDTRAAPSGGRASVFKTQNLKFKMRILEFQIEFKLLNHVIPSSLILWKK